MSKIRILSISDDDGLRLSRELLLQRDGYETESITSTTAVSVSRARSFDVAVICRSVKPSRAMALTEMLKRYNPEIQVLCISQLDDQFASRRAIDLEIPSSPKIVLETVREMCTHRFVH